MKNCKKNKIKTKDKKVIVTEAQDNANFCQLEGNTEMYFKYLKFEMLQ